MSETIVQIQIFYEIAMAIGSSLDLQRMLKNSLSVYLRKLGCSSGLVLRQQRDDNQRIRYRNECSIPATFIDRRLAVKAELRGS